MINIILVSIFQTVSWSRDFLPKLTVEIPRTFGHGFRRCNFHKVSTSWIQSLLGVLVVYNLCC